MLASHVPQSVLEMVTRGFPVETTLESPLALIVVLLVHLLPYVGFDNSSTLRVSFRVSALRLQSE